MAASPSSARLPGAEEARTGKPFVGVSGRMLDENLKSVGLDRATCLVGNTFRYQPPGNKVTHFFSSRTKARKLGVEVAEDLGPDGHIGLLPRRVRRGDRAPAPDPQRDQAGRDHRLGPHADVGTDRPERHHGAARPGTPLPPAARKRW